MTDDAPTVREGPERSDAPAYLARGTLVGRYVILEVLGEGGMGVVYHAYDPELDRKVAIKLVQAQPAGSVGEQWLVREAQALARLSHPNVIAVHDVGTLPGDRVFVAMELVAGKTLRAWLRTPRSWREVLPVMRAAGAGLAAAHAAGLVHRDFKPDNVLVGDDGRVRVMDFGLARADTSDTQDASIDANSPLSEQLTMTGTLVGTPAYMAPEIHDGGPADARTDQFAFGVALFEALYRIRPYEKGQLAPPRGAIAAKLPVDTKVPAAIARVVLRAIAIDAAQRYPSVESLMSDLAIDPGARRRRFAIAGVIAAAAIAALGGTYAASRAHVRPCTGDGARLAGVWDPPVKAAVQKAFDASGKPYAKQAYAGLAKALDGYTTRWLAGAVDACTATRLRGEQPESVMALREACLDQRLDVLRALTGLLADADGGLVEKGDKIAADLPRIADCADVAALAAPGKPPPELLPKVQALERALAVARADLIAARYVGAMVKANADLAEAATLHWDPALAEAKFIQGTALLAVNNQADAAAAFRESTWAALRGRRDDLVTQGAVSTAMITAVGLAKPADAQVWVELAEATAARSGVNPALHARLYSAAGVVAAERGDLAHAVQLHEQALAAVKADAGADNGQLTTVENDLAASLSRAGAYAKAAEHFERALALRLEAVGPDHPDVALILSNLGPCYRHMHQPDKARDAFERALALREKIYGKTSPMLIATLDNFAELLSQQGEHDAAIAMVERARALCEKLPGKQHPMYHQLLTDYGGILAAAGQYAGARARYDEAIALEDPASAVLPSTQTGRAELAVRERRWDEAAGYAERAIAGYETAGGKDNPELWRALAALARAKLGAGKPAEARPLLERALAIGDKAQITPEDLQPLRETLAKLP